ncbi:hypothetical protein D3C81_536330 [compost metagenome]
MRLLGCGIGQRRTAEVANVVDQRCRRVQRLLQAHRVEHVCQAVMAVLQQAEQRRTGLQLPGSQQFIEKLQFVGQIADRRNLDHARTTLEGMQVAQQVLHLDRITRFGLPAQQGGAGAFDNIEALFEENLQQFLVTGFLHRVGRLVRCRNGRCAVTILTQRRQQRHRRRGRAARLELFKHLGQVGMTATEQAEQLSARGETSIHQAFVQQLKFLGEHLDRTDGGHLRTTLEGLQVTVQRRQRRGIVGIGQPAFQRLVGALQHIAGLFEKQLDHGRIHRQRCRCSAQVGDLRLPLTMADQPRSLWCQRFVEQFTQGFKAFRMGIHLLTGSKLVEHVDQRLVGVLRLFEKACTDGQAAFLDRAVQVQQGFAEFIHLPQVSQVGALAQGGQFIEQRREFLTFARVLLPAQQQRFGIEQDIHALGEKAGNQLRIAFDPQALARRLKQGLQTCFNHLMDFLDQGRSTADHRQRRTGQLCQAAAQQRFGALQQVDFFKVEGQLMGLELSGQQVERGGKLGNR